MLTDSHLSSLRTFRGYTEDEAELAARAADEVVSLRAKLAYAEDWIDNPNYRRLP